MNSRICPLEPASWPRHCSPSARTCALAQPGGGMAHHGHGHGPCHRAGDRALKEQLNLNTSQQVMWDNAVAQTKAARARPGARVSSRCTPRSTPSSRRPEPDFAAVAALADAGASEQPVAAQAGPRRVAAALRDVLAGAEGHRSRRGQGASVARMEAFREKMKEALPVAPAKLTSLEGLVGQAAALGRQFFARHTARLRNGATPPPVSYIMRARAQSA